eukprot:6005400-Alexandrium_andersonii.AAC.1
MRAAGAVALQVCASRSGRPEAPGDNGPCVITAGSRCCMHRNRPRSCRADPPSAAAVLCDVSASGQRLRRSAH